MVTVYFGKNSANTLLAHKRSNFFEMESVTCRKLKTSLMAREVNRWHNDGVILNFNVETEKNTVYARAIRLSASLATG